MPSKYKYRKSSRERGYTWTWEKARALYLESNPLCRFCHVSGMVQAANVVDHIIPHKGDMVLFWDESNWQPLCETCHNSTKALIENRGYSNAVDALGYPIDPNHPVNKVDV